MLFAPFRPHPNLRPRSQPMAANGITIRWLGTAGFSIETQATTLLIDPFFSRPSLLRVTSRRLLPDVEAIRQGIPNRVDAIVCGHSHYDHLLDAPTIARMTGARLWGSRTTALFAQASGVALDRITCVPPEGAAFRVGDLEVRFLPSAHARLWLGRVPADGELRTLPSLPARATEYRMGGAFGIWVRAAGLSLYHNGSADLVEGAMNDVRADIALVGLAGRHATRDYLARLFRILRPSLVLPAHHDAFFTPLSEGPRLLPRVDFDGFLGETRTLAPKARIVAPLYLERIQVPASDPGAASIVDD